MMTAIQTAASPVATLKSACLARTLAALDAATRDVTTAELAFHPPGKWSAAEVLEHLAMTYGSTARMLTKLAVAERPRASVPSLRQRAFIAVVTGFGYMPTGRQAPEFTRPKGLSGEAALRQARDGLIAMDAPLAECARRFGQSSKLADHPVLGPLNAREWARFHWVHTRHHLKQIAHLRQMQR